MPLIQKKMKILPWYNIITAHFSLWRGVEAQKPNSWARHDERCNCTIVKSSITHLNIFIVLFYYLYYSE